MLGDIRIVDVNAKQQLPEQPQGRLKEQQHSLLQPVPVGIDQAP